MRGGNVLGRFDSEFEVKSIRSGITQDLQRPVGQIVQWFLYDESQSTVDPIYDVGAQTGGRVWLKPFDLPVVNAYVFQNEIYQNDRGFYAVDTLRLFVNYDDVVRFIPTLDSDPDRHIKDRVVFRGQIYTANRIFPRGQINYDYMVLTVDLTQVKPEEQVNDRYDGLPPMVYPNQMYFHASSGNRVTVSPQAAASAVVTV